MKRHRIAKERWDITMGRKKQNGSFIVQASILAAAGILCRIIGILYRSPLTSIIKDEGNGYYTSAYNIYAIILLLSSYSIPSAISKVIAERLAMKEYRNAHRIFKCALIYVIIVGGIASLFTFFGAGILVEENSVIVLKVFAPTVFLSGILGVLRGYFQAHGTMVQTSLSQILEQILNAAISIIAAYLLIQTVSGKDSTTQAIYGATGSAMGTGAGVLIALIFMYAMYLLNRKWILGRVKGDTRNTEESYSKIFKIIFLMVTPVIMSTFIYNANTVINQTIYMKLYHYVKGVDYSTVVSNYGIFGGKAVVIMNIPIAISSAMSAAMIPSVSATYAVGTVEETNKKIGNAIRTTMLIAIPSFIGMAALARPIVQLLFHQKESLYTAASLLRALSICVIFYSLSTITNAVLQGIGKVNKPVINAAVALVVQSIILTILVLFTELNMYSLVIAMIVYSALMCILNGFSVRKCLGYRENWMKTFGKPLIASIVMGGIAILVYKACYFIRPSNTLALFVAIGAAAMAYAVMLFKLKMITEEELISMPKGTVLIRLAKKMRLLK